MSNDATVNYSLLRRNPTKWAVEFEGREAVVQKTGLTKRGQRWRLLDGGNSLFFRSRREAFYFFRTGKKFVTTPVFAVLNGKRSLRRVR